MRFSLLTTLCFIVSVSGAQNVFAPLNKDYSHLVDRYEITSGRISANLHTSFKPYLRRDVIKMTVFPLHLKGKADAFNFQYLLKDNPEYSLAYDSVPKLFKTFYTQ